jgi:hypothetical protein
MDRVASPVGSGDQLIMCRRQLTEIGDVLAARSLIDAGVQLQMNLIEPAGDVEHKRSVASALGPLSEADRQAEFQKLGWTRIQPVRTESERLSNVLGGFCKPRWERLA